MYSLLKRWLHRHHRLIHLHLHSRGSTDARKRLEPVGIPNKYVSEELAGEYAKYWKKIQEDNGEGLEEIQVNALNRWHAFRFDIGEGIEQYPLPLDFFTEGLYTKVELADETPESSTWVGLTTRKRQLKFSGPPEIQIQLKRLPIRPWTRELIQEFFDTLLHEMSHAFLMIYSTPAGAAGGSRYGRVVETEGLLTGHSPCWVKVAAAIAAEADRSLGGLWDKWELKIADSCYLEKGALRELKGWCG